MELHIFIIVFLQGEMVIAVHVCESNLYYLFHQIVLNFLCLIVLLNVSEQQ